MMCESDMMVDVKVDSGSVNVDFRVDKDKVGWIFVAWFVLNPSSMFIPISILFYFMPHHNHERTHKNFGSRSDSNQVKIKCIE